jgi:CO/xanthine dehydrogenase Mo-binding subunit
MLYGKILRSPHTHARILSVNTAHAEELPGVHAVITSKALAQPSSKLVDLAEGVLHNMRFLSNNIMAADKVLYKGHAVAAVAATSPYIAEEALKLIQVEYAELPPVRNAEEAMAEGAPARGAGRPGRAGGCGLSLALRSPDASRRHHRDADRVCRDHCRQRTG